MAAKIREVPSMRTAWNAKSLVKVGLASLCLALLASCATAPYTPSEKKVQKLVALIDKGGVGAVKGLSVAPFLLDAEILLRQADVDTAWANLKAAGFTMGEPKVSSIERLGDGSYARFAESMEVRSFFKRYLNKDSVLVALDAAEGRYYLILNREVSGYPRIQAFKGPVK
jgi:hypothetical protein